MSKKQATYLAVGSIIGLIVIGATAYILARPDIIKEANQNMTSPEDQSATTTAQEVDKKNKAGIDIDKKLTYQEAIKKFEGHRIQFENCFTMQTSMTFKSGTQIMLDSRSPDPQEIRLDGVPYRLGGYEFRVITLGRYSGLHTVKLDCQVNDVLAYSVAQILVQP